MSKNEDWNSNKFNKHRTQAQFDWVNFGKFNHNHYIKYLAIDLCKPLTDLKIEEEIVHLEIDIFFYYCVIYWDKNMNAIEMRAFTCFQIKLQTGNTSSEANALVRWHLSRLLQ